MLRSVAMSKHRGACIFNIATLKRFVTLNET